MFGNITRLLATAALLVLLAAGVIQASQNETGPDRVGASFTDIRVSFKVDSRVSKGAQTEQRWVSPDTLPLIQSGRQMTVEVRAQGVDAKGKLTDIDPVWTSANPKMVEVTPSQGQQVKITVLSSGQTGLRVDFGGFSKELRIKAVYRKSAILVGIAQNKPAPAGAAIAPPAGITILFKLDPRLTRGMYLGDRWVSPPTYTAVHEGKEVAVDARAQSIDANGRLAGTVPRWTPSDPEMVTVLPAEGHQVKITVRRAGQSKLKVVCGELSTELLIRATYRDSAIQVEIAQQDPSTSSP